jgi:hypothetical protein
METQQTDHSAKIMKRYNDAYLVARTTIGIAGTIKTLGFVFGGTIALIGLSVGSQGHGNHIFQYGGLILGTVIAIPLYVLGVLIAAKGQVLKATLDEAVHTSPFLTNDQRASVMSLDIVETEKEEKEKEEKGLGSFNNSRK